MDFPAVSDAQDRHDQAVIFDPADEPVVSHAVPPELREARACSRDTVAPPGLVRFQTRLSECGH
jgi:hypothetical protein